MVKLIAAIGSTLVAATFTTSIVDGQAPAPAPTTVTAVGCIVRNGMVDVDKGTRRLNMEPNGLALTEARVTTAGRGSSAVPGSIPDSNTGTIPRDTIVGRPNSEPEAQSFALSGSQLTSLGDYVGRRVEIVGRLVATTDEASGSQVRGTTGTARDAGPVTGTREERAGEGPAHPSTELQRLDVTSFRAVSGACP